MSGAGAQRAAIACATLLLIVACSTPEGIVRDQLLFVANDGAVLALGLVRHASGTAEAKGWLGVDDKWQTPLYDRFPIVGRRAGDLAAAVRSWSGARKGGVRASWRADAAGSHLQVRTPTARLWLDGERPVALGDSADPEGRVEWAVARAHLRVSGRDRDGWLVTEHTPQDEPLRAHVDYGDFAFVVAVRRDGQLVVAKRSLGRKGYDFVLWGRPGATKRSHRVRVDVDGEALAVLGGEPVAPIATGLSVRDRASSEGEAPGGRSVVYETLLLGGQWAGVAFRIR